MKTIYKYELSIKGQQVILMPIDSYILSVQMQNGKMCMWVLVNPDRQTEPINFYIVGTGHVVDFLPSSHIATVIDNQFVWHLFSDIK